MAKVILNSKFSVLIKFLALNHLIMAKNREVIQLHIGQAGNQIAHSCWQLYCFEHGIYPDGSLYYVDAAGEDCNAFFSINRSCKVCPRVLFIDLEPSVIGKNKFLFF